MRPKLIALAWLNVLLHLAGLGLAAIYMRPGTPLTPLAERQTYLASWPSGWVGSWAVWALAAFAMIGFAVAVAARINTPLARWGAGIAVAAAAIDLTCDTLLAFYLPALASGVIVQDFEFVDAERVIGFVSLLIANGLYSLSTLLLSVTMRERAAVLPLGIAVFVCGMLLSAAGVTGVPDHAFWATGPTIGLYCAWVLVVAYSLDRGSCA
jgi:hypothetical protein